MTKIKIYTIFLLLLSSCAIRKPPSGGPPDTTPPVIVSTYPQNMTRNFSDDYVQIEFSKYMSKTQVIENIFISPEIKSNFDWSGKKLDIEFLENLKENTTYSITLGTDYTDIKGNKPEMSFSLIFSTGDVIDSCRIAGELIDEQPADAFIFAYRTTGIDADTLNPAHTKPSYRTQIGSSGMFLFSALKPGNYRIFAVRDKMKDNIYDYAIDNFGAYYKDIFTDDTTIPEINIKLGPPIDISGPMLYGVESLTERKVIAEFSESLDSTSIRKEAFSISDSGVTINIPIHSAFLEHGTANKIVLITETSPDTSRKWLLEVAKSGEYALRDSSGNIIQDTLSTAYFYASAEKEDYPVLSLVESIPSDSTENVPLNSYFDFVFDNNIKIISDSLKIKFTKTADNSEVEFSAKFPMENILRIRPEKALANLTDYRIEIKGIPPNRDSLLSLNFVTDDERTYGGLAGIIRDSSGYKGQYLITLKSSDSDLMYYTVTKDTTWKFEHLPPGDYQLEISSDINENGKYDFGNPYPWEFAEKFMLLTGTIHIKPRWMVEDFKIIYEGK